MGRYSWTHEQSDGKRGKMATHRMSKTKEYKIWCKIKLNNPKEIWLRWHKFENFHDDMGDLPKNCNTILRIDPEFQFSKENCIWGYVGRGRPFSSNYKIKPTYKEKKFVGLTIEKEHFDTLNKMLFDLSLEEGRSISMNEFLKEMIVSRLKNI